ncbi:hypothetical protein [Mycolicibacterium komossense]|uniref:Intersectin-EH binding protein Ibp1 n=1 Tax=Mycolicibacterium komossense TaxID=1779 RepID=A0ABT3CE08_9MYCO|nr:hypothetical protein [Mycolicibacterium komossense]MCV7227704.1 hypothetical protein [Mycolicibacterium komossense]
MKATKTLRHLTPLVVATGAAAILMAPIASADETAAPAPAPSLPTCTNVGGDQFAGPSTTECATPGNVQLNSSPPLENQNFLYPWNDDIFGPALVIG